MVVSWPLPKRVIFPERVHKFETLATLIPDSSRLPPGRGKVHHALWCHFLFEERSCHHNPQDTGLLKNWMLNVAMAALFFSYVMSFFQIPILLVWSNQYLSPFNRHKHSPGTIGRAPGPPREGTWADFCWPQRLQGVWKSMRISQPNINIPKPRKNSFCKTSKHETILEPSVVFSWLWGSRLGQRSGHLGLWFREATYAKTCLSPGRAFPLPATPPPSEPISTRSKLSQHV